MGRRTLRKISPDIDWVPYLLIAEEMQGPLDPATLYDDEAAPLEVELGSGKGLFIETASGERSHHNFLGLEVSGKYARYSAARLAKHQRSNARMVHGDGLRVFSDVLADASVHAVHVYFPDPWWKKRHHRRRVMRPEFLSDVQRTLEAGGTLHFWTDVEEYFVATMSLLADTDLEGPLPVLERPAHHDLDFQTHFERRTRLHDKPVYRAAFRKC